MNAKKNVQIYDKTYSYFTQKFIKYFYNKFALKIPAKSIFISHVFSSYAPCSSNT